MKARTYIRILVAAGVFTAVCLAARLGAASEPSTRFPWYSIVPPAMALILAFLTHHVILSLGISLLVGGLLSSTATSCGLLDHVRTQLPYSLTVAAVAVLCAYIPSALGMNPLLSLAISIPVLLAILFAFGRRTEKQASLS